MAKTTTARNQMRSRVAYAIENGNSARITKISYAEAEKIATEILEATNYKSLAAARRELNARKIWHEL